ncbi:MAG: DUF4926 domain-containing protein [Planctomycetes bacterium]|nr:DUF4926 domain-containing protein [Planctomycetota bacterium]
MLKEHDVVALTDDLPAESLCRGDVGAIVHCHANGGAFEVEFVDEQARNHCVITVPAKQLMRLNLLSLSA